MIETFQHFGEGLRYYRETYQERLVRNNTNIPDMPHVRIPATSLIGCMDRKGYSISSGAYSEIEQGISIPKDPRAFLEAAAKCLAIEEGSDEWISLLGQLGIDIVKKKVGEVMGTEMVNSMARVEAARNRYGHQP